MFKRITLALVLVIAAAPLFAHCDSMNGPVITEAKKALEKNDVTPLLKWIPAAKEGEIRAAFAKTVAARTASLAARDVADQWFFETLVRVHRESEGAPFTGLKGPEYQPEEGIELADQAIESKSIDAAQKELLATISAGLLKRYAEVLEAKKHANESVEEGRHYVHAYVEFIHYVERLHAAATEPAGHHGMHPQMTAER